MSETIFCSICNEAIHSVEVHLKKVSDAAHNMTLARYRELYPDAPILSEAAQRIVDKHAADQLAMQAADLVIGHAGTLSDMPEAGVRKAHSGASFSQVAMQDLFKLSEPVLNTRKQSVMCTVMNPGADLLPYIPPVDDSHVWDVEVLRSMSMALETGMPLYLYGHKGTGKTNSLEQLAARTRRAMLRVQHSIGTEESQIVGQMTVQGGQTVFELGPLALAMRHGWIYLADEYDFALPAVLAVYQAVLEGKSLVIKEAPLALRVIAPHPNFRFWANGNTNGSGDESGLYSGTSVQNAANYDRFAMMLQIKYMEPAQETEILVKRTGLAKKEAEKLVGLASSIREEFDRRRIGDTISTRALVNIARVGLMRADMRMGIRLCYTNKLNQVDRTVVDGLAQRIFG